MTLVLCACTGGGSGSSVAPIAGPIVPGSATFSLSFGVPNRLVTSSARAPRYVSQGTAAVAVYDGATVIFVGNFNAAANPQFTTVFAKTGTTTVSGGSCVVGTSNSTCTITITTTIGAHTFDAITYPVSQGQPASHDRAPADVGTVPTFTGVILAEGELAVTLSPGTNAGQTVALLGVADHGNFTGPTLTQHLNGNGPLVGVIGTTYTFQYVINDSANFQIAQPGNYDNGPVTIAETDANNIVTMTPISQTTPPAALGAQSFNVTCLNNGTATITAGAQNKPNATYASGLTYSASNYPTATIGTTTLQCVPNSATLPVTVQ
jgi:hypothetical protein